MIDITPIILAIIALLLAVLVVFIIPFLKNRMGVDDYEKNCHNCLCYCDLFRRLILDYN